MQMVAGRGERDRNPSLGETPSEASAVIGDTAAAALLDDQHAAPVQLTYRFGAVADHLTRHRGCEG